MLPGAKKSPLRGKGQTGLSKFGFGRLAAGVNQAVPAGPTQGFARYLRPSLNLRPSLLSSMLNLLSTTAKWLKLEPN